MPPSSRSKKQNKQTQPRKAGNAQGRGEKASQGSGTDTLRPHALPFELQQIILNTFNSAFPIAQDPEQLKQLIQEVKGHLFNRDFSVAFGQPSYLHAYALRWSAARALSYSQILSDPKRSTTIFPYSEPDLTGQESVGKQPVDMDDSQSTIEASTSRSSSLTKVVCVGGGAGGEVVAIAAAHRALGATNTLSVFAVDSADWSEPVSKLCSSLSVGPTPPAYSTEVFRTRPENQPLLEDTSKVNVTFIHQDVLSWPIQSFQNTLQDASLCTVMFTLNELFSTSLPRTTAFLLHLTDFMPGGSHLLVIDSPGSYSEISLGKSKGGSPASLTSPTPGKKYPMKWLLDHTLLEVAGQAEARWAKLESEDSLWFRIDQKDRERLKYPVELENMRYQLHLYRKV